MRERIIWKDVIRL